MKIAREKRLGRKIQSSVHILGGLVSRPPVDNKTRGCSNPLYKTAKSSHITYLHPPIDFESPPDYL